MVGIMTSKKLIIKLILLLLITIISFAIISPSKNSIKRLVYKSILLLKEKPIEKTIDAQLKHLKNNPISSDSIVFLGDSLINLGDWNVLLKKNTIVNLGINGLTIPGLINSNFLEFLSPFHQIYILIGINDFWNHSDVSTIINHHSRLIKLLRKKGLKNIHFIALLPVDHKFLNTKETKIDKYNQYLKKSCKENKFEFIDVSKKLSAPKTKKLKDEYTYDGIHLTGEGYKAFAKSLNI